LLQHGLDMCCNCKSDFMYGEERSIAVPINTRC